MRRLLWLVLAVAALWAGYWVVGSSAVKRGAEAWFAGAAAQGIEARNAGVRVGGFPNIFDLSITAPDLFDPASGYGWRAESLDIYAMTWKPWHLIAILPPVQVATTPAGEVTLAADKLRASVVFHPGADLALNRTVVEAAGLEVTGVAGTWGIVSASAATTEDQSRRDGHRIGVQVSGIAPDPAVSAALPDLPALVTGVHLDATVLLSAPLDRHASGAAPQVTGIVLRDASVDWGPLVVRATGSLAAASEGYAEGRIDVRIEGWRLLPAALGQIGLIDPVLAPTLLRAMEVLARDGADARVLEVPLTMKGGTMRFGPLPVGPAPRLVRQD